MAALRKLRLSMLLAPLLVIAAILPCHPQSDRSLVLAATGAWRLHSRIPLGQEEFLLEPAHRLVDLLATAEQPAFAGWTLELHDHRPVLLDASGHPVQKLPSSITFRVTASTRDRLIDADPAPLPCNENVEDFLLQLHFSLQVFRGMQMRKVEPARQWLIGVPADEPSDERIYRVSFNLGDARPDDRIVLLVTDASGSRLTKFHLEFL